METAHLKDLFLAQAKLDSTIAENHHISYETTRNRRIMALTVEVGELANATRCFKYWSNKPSETKDIVLDEYADGLHFFLSLGIDIKSKKMDYEIYNVNNDLTEQFLDVYKEINSFRIKQDEESYIKAFQTFLNILPLLGYNWADLDEAYFKKLDTNYKRQENNY